jgi:hypothetical protein
MNGPKNENELSRRGKQWKTIEARGSLEASSDLALVRNVIFAPESSYAFSETAL